MKNLLIPLLCLLPVWTQAQLPENDWKKLNLKGKVHIMKEFNYDELEDGGMIIKGKLNSINNYSFNEDGYLTGELVTNRDGIQIFRVVYTYDESKRLAGKDIFFEQVSSTIQNRYKFSPEGKLSEETQFRNRNLEFTTQYEYNKKGEQIERNSLNWVVPDQSFKVTFKYDDAGKLIEKYTDQVSVIYRHEFYKYDQDGNLSEVSYSRKKAKPDGKVNFTYQKDEKGNWIIMTETAAIKLWSKLYYRERTYEYY